MPPIVRVPSTDYHHIARACDMGAEGIMLPMVGDGQGSPRHPRLHEVSPRRASAAWRSAWPMTLYRRHVAEKLAAANERTTLFCQIETAEGVENADEIAAVDGVDCLWVGHFDLSVSLGIPGQFDNPKFTQGHRHGGEGRAQAQARRSAAWFRTSKPASTTTSKGFDFICYSGDVWVLQAALGRCGRQAALCLRRRNSAHGAPFRVALSGDFRKADGSPTFPDFDLTPLRNAPGVEMTFLEPANPLDAGQLEDFDALILLAHRFARESVPIQRPARRRRALRRRLRHGRCRRLHRGRHRAGHHAGRRAPAGGGLDHHLHAGADRQADGQGPADPRQGPAAFDQRVRAHGRRPGGPARSARIGIGNIGAELFRLAKPFDMKFIAHDPFADKTVAAELGIELVSLDELFRRADVLSVNCPLTPETRHLVNAERLALMKPTAYLINTARGPIVDQKALTKALQERRIAGAGLDVLEAEPPDPATIRSSSSTTSSWRRTRCAGPTSALPATAPPTSRRCSTCSMAGCRAAWSIAPCSNQPRFKAKLKAFASRFGA